MVGYRVSVFAIHATDMHDCTVRRIQRPAYRSPPRHPAAAILQDNPEIATA